MKKFSFSAISITLGAAFLVFGTVWAFTGPGAAPPGANVDQPIDVGSANQTKIGGLFVGSLGVDGGVRFNTTGGSGQPACDAANTRGSFWFTHGAAGVKDTLEVCAKDAADVYAWRLLY
jgi:hypothetical protein